MNLDFGTPTHIVAHGLGGSFLSIFPPFAGTTLSHYTLLVFAITALIESGKEGKDKNFSNEEACTNGAGPPRVPT
jgi:hypothetical protein